MDDFLGGKTGL